MVASPRTLDRSRLRIEPLVWCAVALCVALVQLPLQRVPRLADDSFQYLSAAKQLRETHHFTTTLVHFDTERSHGTIPAPMTWFPPGYPMAIAIVSMTGLGYETSALLVSMVAFLLVTAGVWHLARLLDPSLWVTRAAVVCWLLNAYAMEYAVSAISELVFAVFTTASLLLLLHMDGRKSSLNNGLLALAAAITAGASYWVRYAGLLCAIGFPLLLLLALLRCMTRERARAALVMVVSVASMALMMLPLICRNIRLVGDWRGGNNIPASMPVWTVLREFPAVMYHLILGSAAASQLRIPTVMLALGILGLGVVWGLARRAAPDSVSTTWAPPFPATINLASVLIYTGLIAALATRSVVGCEPRKFVPFLPSLIVLVACGVAVPVRRMTSPARSRLASPVILLIMLGYAWGNVVSRLSAGPDEFALTKAALQTTAADGRTIGQLLDRELRPGEVIAATNGQACGYIVHHPTLSLVGPHYSLLRWNAGDLRGQLARFGAVHVVVFKDANLDPVVADAPLLSGLSAGRAPQWLQLDGCSSQVCLYRVR